MKNYEPNVVSFAIMTRWKCWYVVGSYVPPNKGASGPSESPGRDGYSAGRKYQCLLGATKKLA